MSKASNKQAYVREILQTRFAEAKGKNPAFSSRRFASLLGISVSTYSEFMSDRRFLSEELLRRLIDYDKMDESGRMEFDSLPYKAEKIIGTFDNPTSSEHYKNITKKSDGTYVLHLDEKSVKQVMKNLDSLIQKLAHVCEEQTQASKKTYVLNLTLKEIKD